MTKTVVNDKAGKQTAKPTEPNYAPMMERYLEEEDEFKEFLARPAEQNEQKRGARKKNTAVKTDTGTAGQGLGEHAEGRLTCVYCHYAAPPGGSRRSSLSQTTPYVSFPEQLPHHEHALIDGLASLYKNFFDEASARDNLNVGIRLTSTQRSWLGRLDIEEQGFALTIIRWIWQ